jgi:hypothetical protein
MFSFYFPISYQENVNENCNELTTQPDWNGFCFKNITNAGETVDKKNPYTLW